MRSGFAEMDRQFVAAAGDWSLRMWRVGVPFPLLLAAWRLAFFLPMAAVSAAMAFGAEGFEEAAEGYRGAAGKAVLALLAVSLVATVVDARGMLADACRGWTPDLFRKYALRALSRRASFFGMRTAVLLMVASSVGSALFALVQGSDAARLAGLVLLLGTTLSVGGYLDACDPPPPGRREPLARPAHA